jgi:Tfp pilus assembly protein PilX
MSTLIRHLSRRLRDERGMALMLAIALTTILGAVSVTVVQVVQSEQSRSTQAVKRDASFQAAEAGIDEYTAKLLDDGSYDVHNVHAAESTRKATGGTLVTPSCTGTPAVCTSVPWNYGASWTYPNGKDRWRSLGNGYEYNLEVRPPAQGTNGAVSVLATGRPSGSTDKRTWRTLFGQVRPAGLADFQMIADADISYGATATTYGKIYAARDANGVAHNVNHAGNAYADIYAEGSITGGVVMHNGAQKYPSSTVRTVITSPIIFRSFLASISAIQTAAQPAQGGLSYDATGAYNTLWFTFNAGTGQQGTVTVKQCAQAKDSSNNPIAVQSGKPTNCATIVTNQALPTNGAIYAADTSIVQGTVNGQVTLASAGDIVIGDNIYYNDARTGCSSGASPAPQADDVLGLDATNYMYIASWVGTNLSWCAATIAQNYKWESDPSASNNSHGTMDFTGSTATEQGGQMSMFATRHYNYDPALLWIQPPWFPVIAGQYTVYSKHELPPTFGF